MARRAPASTPRRGADYLAPCAVFTVALSVRLAYLLEWSRSDLFGVLVGDAMGYDVWARELVSGRGWWDEVFYQAPLYPHWLALLYATVGSGVWVPRAAQAGIGALGCALLCAAGRRWHSPPVGWLAGLGLALYAPALHYDGLVQSVSLSIALAAALIWFMAQSRDQSSLALWTGGGVIAGLLALARENALVALPWLFAWALLCAGKPGTAAFRRVAGVALGVALVLGPVGLRNLEIGGRFLLTTAQLGPNLYIGNHPGATGRYVPLRPGRGGVRYEREDARQLAEAALGRSLSPAEVSDYWVGRALAFARGHPLAWLRLTARKLHLVAHRAEIVDTDSFEAQLDHSALLWWLRWPLNFGVIAPLAAVGVFAVRGRWREFWGLWAIAATFAIAVAAFFVMGRYRAPLIPFALLFAAAGTHAVVRAARSRSGTTLAWLVGVGALAAAVSNAPLALGGDPRAITYHALGLRLSELGRTDDAIAWLERGLQLAPEFLASRLLLGDLLRDSGELEGALNAYGEVLARDPESALAWSHIGSALEVSSNAEAARRAFTRALELDPSDVDANNNLGNHWLRRGDAARALELYQRAVMGRPEAADLHANVGTAFAALGRFPEAYRALTRALELDPEHRVARVTRAGVAEQLAIDESGLSDFEHAARQPAPPDAIWRAAWLGVARLRAGCTEDTLHDPARATDALDAVLRAFPLDPEALALQGQLQAGTYPQRTCSGPPPP
jgi:tetratricopeptide (TPR) repeat protein